MSIEILGAGGALKACGTLALVPFPGNNTVRALGVTESVTQSEFVVRLTLSDPIAESEFLILLGGSEGSAVWIDDTHVDLFADDELLHFAIYRIAGLGTFTDAAIAPPPP